MHYKRIKTRGEAHYFIDFGIKYVLKKKRFRSLKEHHFLILFIKFSGSILFNIYKKLIKNFTYEKFVS